MAAITYPLATESDAEVRGASARAAAVRARGGAVRRAGAPAPALSPALFSGDGRLRRSPVVVPWGVPWRDVPLEAHDDLASLDRRAGSVVPTGRPTALHGPFGRPEGTRDRPPLAATYRRRRFVVAALLLGALLACSWVPGALGGGSLTASESRISSNPAGGPPVALQVQPVSRSTYVVEPGDTLWSIARHLQPSGDVRPVVDALAAGRSGRPLEVGERIVLP